MQILNASKLTDDVSARLIAIYGDTGVGKSYNSIPRIDTIPEGKRVLYVQVEDKNPLPELRANGIDVSHVDYVQYAGHTYNDLREFFHDLEKIKRYYAVVVDSGTQLMENIFKEIVDETKGKRTTEKAKTFTLGDEVRAEQADYGAISEHMKRFFDSLGVYRNLGVNFIFLFKLGIDKQGKFAPMIVGNHFADRLPYYVDLLGMAVPMPPKDGKFQPPKVFFDEMAYRDKNGAQLGYLRARYAGVNPADRFKAFPFDTGKIIARSFGRI